MAKIAGGRLPSQTQVPPALHRLVDMQNPQKLTKLEQYREHVSACRECRRCGDEVQNRTEGRFADHPSPWAAWMGSLSAKLVVVGQDFSATDRIGTDRPWFEPDRSLATNVNLKNFISGAGIGEDEVYLTNAMLCMKPGGMSQKVSRRWIRNCQAHLLNTIQLIKPVAVAALGGVAWSAVCDAFFVPRRPLASQVGHPPVTVDGGTALFALNHCGRLGTIRRPFELQQQDWLNVGAWIRAHARTHAA